MRKADRVVGWIGHVQFSVVLGILDPRCPGLCSSGRPRERSEVGGEFRELDFGEEGPGGSKEL